MSLFSRVARPLCVSANTQSMRTLALNLTTPRLLVGSQTSFIQVATFRGEQRQSDSGKSRGFGAIVAASSLVGGVLLYEKKKRNSNREDDSSIGGFVPVVSARSRTIDAKEDNNNNNNDNSSVGFFPSVSANSWEASPRPPPTPSRVADYGVDVNGMKFTLYQYQTCPFCCKARVFLDYYGISYDVVEVNSVKRTEIKWSKYKKVPLLVIETPDGKTVQLNDSSQIISVLKTFIDHKASRSVDELVKNYPHLEEETKKWYGGSKSTFDFPNKYFLMYFDEPADSTSKTTSKARSVERKWRSWVDSDFVHRISPNIYGSFDQSLEAFRYFDQVGQWDKIFSWFDRMIVIYLGAFVMRLVAVKLKKQHELDDDVRDELNKSVNRFVKKALKNGANQFAGGDRISLGDLALFGAMTSFQGCSAFQDMMAANQLIAKWFENVKKAVESHEGQSLLKEAIAEEAVVVEGQ